MNMYLSEVLAMFVFALIVSAAAGDAMTIAVGLFVAIKIASIASPAHLNPAFTGMNWLQGNVDNTQAVGLVLAQLVGVILAVYWFKQMQLKQ